MRSFNRTITNATVVALAGTAAFVRPMLLPLDPMQPATATLARACRMLARHAPVAALILVGRKPEMHLTALAAVHAAAPILWLKEGIPQLDNIEQVTVAPGPSFFLSIIYTSNKKIFERIYI